jgi:hypothetical protein
MAPEARLPPIVHLWSGLDAPEHGITRDGIFGVCPTLAGQELVKHRIEKLEVVHAVTSLSLLSARSTALRKASRASRTREEL